MNLLNRIKLASGVSLLLFLGAIFFQVSAVKNEYDLSVNLKESIKASQYLSAIVTETQKERGKTAIYFGSKKTKSGLIKQRAKNDSAIESYKSFFNDSSFLSSDEYLNEVESKLSEIVLIRAKVLSGEYKLKDALVAYTKVVSHILDYQLYLSRFTKDVEIANNLNSLRLLEEAKESGGKLRANLSNVLAKDKPISKAKFNTILKLKAGLESNLKSVVLSLDKKQVKSINDFFLSREWNRINKVFSDVLIKSNEGNYGYKAEEFFETISIALGNVAKEIKYQSDKTYNLNVGKSSKLSTFLNIVYAISISLCILVLGLSIYTVRSTSFSISRVIKTISEEVNKFSSISTDMSAVCSDMNSETNKQRKSLETAVSAIDEISSMVQRNAESAEKSSIVSNSSKVKANIGQEKVRSMISAMNDIEDSSRDMESIVDIIKNVGEKAKIINDIVFQTKLLSINASVESARAGEHGKGFAVVAEEVGNLAAVSGKAAKEITKLLEDSIKEVRSSVHDTQKKVESGSKAAIDCQSTLNEIINDIGSINNMIGEISSASTEQASGVSEVQRNIQSLDSVSHKSLSLANRSNDMAEDISIGVKSLYKSIETLESTTGVQCYKDIEIDDNDSNNIQGKKVKDNLNAVA